MSCEGQIKLITRNLYGKETLLPRQLVIRQSDILNKNRPHENVPIGDASGGPQSRLEIGSRCGQIGELLRAPRDLSPMGSLR